MADTGTILALVLAGHFIGDWVVQSDRQAADKVWPSTAWTKYVKRVRGEAWATKEVWPTPHDREVRRGERARTWKANQRHMLGYHLTMCAAVAFSGLDITPAAVLLSISWVTHSFIDRRWPVRWLMRHTGSEAFSETPWGVIAVDQALHLAILCVLVAALRCSAVGS